MGHNFLQEIKTDRSTYRIEAKVTNIRYSFRFFFYLSLWVFHIYKVGYKLSKNRKYSKVEELLKLPIIVMWK